MKRQRKQKSTANRVPSHHERIRRQLWELDNPEPDDAYFCDDPEDAEPNAEQLKKARIASAHARVRVLVRYFPVEWREYAQGLVSRMAADNASDAEISLNLTDRLGTIDLYTPRESRPGRSANWRRWIDRAVRLLAVSTGSAPSKSERECMTVRIVDALEHAINGTPIPDQDFADLANHRWVGEHGRPPAHDHVMRKLSKGIKEASRQSVVLEFDRIDEEEY